ncbi:MAG: DUF362 domain-containing protein [bacterium]
MKSKVYFIDMRTRYNLNIFQKLDKLLNASPEFKGLINKKDLVAIKTHFGEQGNLSHIHPKYIQFMVNKIREYQGHPFITDASSVYAGTRSDAISHLNTAISNGFAYATIGAPLIIADGLKGNSEVKIPVDLTHFKEVAIAKDIYDADKMICMSHFKGHELTGFGGAIKNIGMGLAAKSGKLAIHSTTRPYISKDCLACGLCIPHCSQGAISIQDNKACINYEKCIGCAQCIISCPNEKIRIRWDESTKNVQEKICEYAYGLLKVRKIETFYLNFIINITPVCDCYNYSDTPIIPDIGILASNDIIAIDQACVDLVNQAEGIKNTALKQNLSKGGDKFKGLFPQIDWDVQLAYGEKIGLGTRNYELQKG